ncbi:MAG: hypothetical protein GQ538_11235 [Xanthomonadales bacterium]|nr:hypothetical protein [Xanthomonadales bacterium]
MKSLTKTNLYALILVSLLTSNLAMSAGIGNTIAVRLVGTAEAYAVEDIFEGLDLEPMSALCFDINLVDIKTGKTIGTASDCLSDITPSMDDNGLKLIGTTFFHFPGGTLISQGLTTVQPVLHGSADFTHITGAVPSAADNGVIYGDGKFKNASGPVRLSGAVNLGSLASDGLITFDCVFIIDI